VDIKDEQLEMIARVHDVNGGDVKQVFAGVSPAKSSTSAVVVPPGLTPASEAASDEFDEHYTTKSVITLSPQGSYLGASAGADFVVAFMEKLSRKVPAAAVSVCQIADSISNSSGLMEKPDQYIDAETEATTSVYVPSRLVADRLVSIYFQEWQSVFVILDQVEFLRKYEAYFEMPESDPTFAVIVTLVCALGSLATKDEVISAETWRLDAEWRRLLTRQVEDKPTLETQQAMLLSLLYAMHTGSIDDMWRYRMICHSMAQRLGLHRDARLIRTRDGKSLSSQEIDLRSRLVWVAYSLDVFSSATLGASRLFRDSAMEADIPSDAVWEFRKEEPTRLQTSTENSITCCQVAVVKLSKILGQVLDSIYLCTKKTHSFKEIVMFEEDLESWHRELAPALKFEFTNNQPAPTLMPLHQKSPLLNQLYQYARILLHLPIVCAPIEDGNSSRGSGSNVAVMQSAKIFIQVYNYLRERHVTPTLPLCTSRSLVLCGGIVLYGAVDYSRSGALIRQVRKTINACLGFMYADSNAQRPGSVSRQCYQWLEEAADLSLKSKQPQPQQQQQQRKLSDPVNRKPRIKQNSSPVAVPGADSGGPPYEVIKLEQLTPPTSDADRHSVTDWASENRSSSIGSEAALDTATLLDEWKFDLQPKKYQNPLLGSCRPVAPNAIADIDPLDLYCCIDDLVQAPNSHTATQADNISDLLLVDDLAGALTLDPTDFSHWP
jgi:hypothetical protein